MRIERFLPRMTSCVATEIPGPIIHSLPTRRDRRNTIPEPSERILLHICLVAKPAYPVDATFAPKPCELAFGVPASGLLNRSSSLVHPESALQHGAQFAVTDEV